MDEVKVLFLYFSLLTNALGLINLSTEHEYCRNAITVGLKNSLSEAFNCAQSWYPLLRYC